MTKVAVVTDSCASIPDELYAALNIIMVPYNLHIGNETRKDLVDIGREEFFAYLARAATLPKTANPGPGDYMEAFKEAAQRSDQVISLHMTSLGSGAYQAASLAKQMARSELPGIRIEVVDTLNVSMCHGWMTIEAARAAQAGQSLDEILRSVQRMIPVTRMIQTADTLRYLHLGGRIGRAKHLVGSILNIKPLIGMEEGIIVALGTARSRRGAYRRIAEMVEEDVGPGGRIKLALVHVAAQEEAEQLRTLVAERVHCVETLMTQLSPVLSVHTGPGTVGVCYFPTAAVETF